MIERLPAYRDGVWAIWMEPELVGGEAGWEIWHPETFTTLARYAPGECADASEALDRYADDCNHHDVPGDCQSENECIVGEGCV